MIIGHGSKLQIGSGGGSETFADIACLSIDLGSNKVDTPDSTHMLTPGTTRTYVPGLEDPGDVSVKFYVDPVNAAQLSLYAAKGAGAKDFKVVYPGGVKTRAFSGIVQSIDESLPDDKGIAATCKIKVSGPIVDTYV